MSKLYYVDKVNKLLVAQRVLSKKSHLLVWGKLISFCLMLIAGWNGLDGFPNIWLSLSVICLLVYLFFVYADNRVDRKREHNQQMIQFYEDEIGYLGNEFSFQDGSEYIDIHSPYSYDLDIFGPGSLFQRLNRTTTVPGEKALAHRLINVNTRISKNDIDQDAINELMLSSDFREDYLSTPHFKSKVRGTSMYSNVNTMPDKNIKWLQIFPFCSFLLILYLILSYILVGKISSITSATLTVLFVLQLFITIALSSKLKTAFCVSKSIIDFNKGYMPVIKKISSYNFKASELREIRDIVQEYLEDLKSIQRIESIYALRANPFLWLLLNGFLSIDVMEVLKFQRWKVRRLASLPTLLESIGKIETLASFAQFNFNHADYCIAKPQENMLINMKNGKHPFWGNSGVGNDFSISKGSISIITGANMSGKSTFSRTIALNLILAKNGCRVPADKFYFNPNSQIFTSMRTRDDIKGGISYFQSEIIRLDKAIDVALNTPNVILFLDEVLKGTNSIDKLEGTKKLLSFFVENGITTVLATHDIDVTSLKLSGVKRNYCFEITAENPPSYPYKLTNGVCQNKNATFLINCILQKQHK